MLPPNNIFIKWRALAIRPNDRGLKSLQFATYLSVLAFYLLMANLAPAAESAPKERLIVGSELDFPPFALVHEGGVGGGFTVELWQAVAREANLQATIKTGPFHEILEQFKSGQIDVLINLALSDERRGFAEFSVPHVKMAGAVFARKGDSRIKSEDDLAGKSLIVINADLAHDYALKRGWTNLTLVDTVASGMKLLASSTQHDAMLVGRLVGLNTTKELKLDNVQPLQLKLQFHQDFAFAVRKGNAELLARINDGLASVRAAGAYDAIYAKWFGRLEPRPLTIESILKYLVPAVVLIFLLTLAYLREHSLRVRWKNAAAALDATIAERKHAETALRESEERFRAFMDRSPAIAFIKDEKGRYVYVNRTWEDLYALDWRGKSDAELWPRDNAAKFSESDRSVLEVGQGNETYETMLDKDGRPQDWWVMKFPIVDADGKRLLGGMALDITERKQVEETLRRRERQLVEAERIGRMGSWELNLLTNRLEWSDEIFRIFEIDPAKFGASYEAFLNAVHPEDRESVNRAFINSLRDRTPYEITHRLLMADGRIKWMHERAETFYDTAGRPLRSLGSVHDISENIRIQESLRAARDELEVRVVERTEELSRSNMLLRQKEEQLVLAQRAGHTGLWNRDLTTGVESTSVEWKNLVGFPVGQDQVSYQEFVDRIHPDDRTWMQSRMSTLANGDFEAEFRINHPEKGTRWILSRGRRGISAADGHLHMMGALIDITERKQAEEALRESEERLRAILDHSPAPVFIKDIAGRYLLVNNRFEELFTICSADAIGKTDAELFNSEQAAAFQTNDRKVLDLGQAIQFEEVAQYHDGEHTSIVNKFPLRDGQGKVYALCGIATDITERKRVEEALRKLTEDLDRRVVERTRELAESQSRLRALVAAITKTEERERRRLAVELHDYLAQMLTISRLNIGRAGKLATDDALKKRLAEAQESVDDSIAYTRTLMAQLSPRVLYDLGLPAALAWLAVQQKERHGLHVELRGETEGFALDEERSVLAYQCVRELLWNIVKHAETNQATVSFAIEHGELTVEVADEGRGFDPESLHGNGNGLEQFGLFSIRERLELFGGKIEVISQPERGTKVRFSLPAPQTEIASMLTQICPPVSLATVNAKQLSVVLVDDHEVVRRGLRQVLEEFEDIKVVGEASDGMEGVELVREFSPNVVVMDVNMPHMNGIEATKIITREQPSTVVVGLSFESGAEVVQAMKGAGAFTCVTKERAAEEIHHAIIAAVDERRKLRTDNEKLIMDNCK